MFSCWVACVQFAGGLSSLKNCLRLRRRRDDSYIRILPPPHTCLRWVCKVVVALSQLALRSWVPFSRGCLVDFRSCLQESPVVDVVVVGLAGTDFAEIGCSGTGFVGSFLGVGYRIVVDLGTGFCHVRVVDLGSSVAAVE